MGPALLKGDGDFFKLSCIQSHRIKHVQPVSQESDTGGPVKLTAVLKVGVPVRQKIYGISVTYQVKSVGIIALSTPVVLFLKMSQSSLGRGIREHGHPVVT
jgi:hypothetical protein